MAEEALWLLDTSKMLEVVEEAKRVHFKCDEIAEVRGCAPSRLLPMAYGMWAAEIDVVVGHLPLALIGLRLRPSFLQVHSILKLPEEKLVELQLKRAVELKDPRRVQNREIRLRDLYIAKFARLYEPLGYPRLRTPLEWAAAKVSVGNALAKAIKGRAATESLAARMMEHSAKPIHISLTELDSPTLAKEALTMFKYALAWAGERPDPLPAAQGRVLLLLALKHPELRAELYVQLIKQLTHNSSAEARSQYWDLLALSLMSSPPGPGCDDFVHAFCLRHAAQDQQRALISQIHKGRYGDSMLTEHTLPPADQLRNIARQFFGMQHKQSSRFSEHDLIAAAAKAVAAKGAVDVSDPAPHLAPPTLHERTPGV